MDSVLDTTSLWWVAPFGDPGINGCSRLRPAYRSVPRPSSPLDAKASTRCPSFARPLQHQAQPPRPHRGRTGEARAKAIEHTFGRHPRTPSTAPRADGHDRRQRPRHVENPLHDVKTPPQGSPERKLAPSPWPRTRAADHAPFVALARDPYRTRRARARPGSNPARSRATRTTRRARARPGPLVALARDPDHSSRSRATRTTRRARARPGPLGALVRDPDQRPPRLPHAARPAATATDAGRQGRGWWAWADSNSRPHAYQACALTGLSYRPGSRDAAPRGATGEPVNGEGRDRQTAAGGRSRGSFFPRPERGRGESPSRLARTLRKEVIQPQVPLRLPCYDFTPVADLTVDGCLLAVSAPASGKANSHGVTGGVYKARERIHRGMLIRDY
jgi:hypothetical protein